MDAARGHPHRRGRHDVATRPSSRAAWASRASRRERRARGRQGSSTDDRPCVAKEGDWITIDGSAGTADAGAIPTIDAEISGEFKEFDGDRRQVPSPQGAIQLRYPA
jgi:hypothetical protein